MKVITVINDVKNFGFNLLRLSCAINNFNLVTLVSYNNFYSRRVKDDLLQIYLDSIEDDDEIVFFTDGIDALLLTTEIEILNKFHRFNAELIFSAETGCWPDPAMADLYPYSFKTPYRFLNSGGFIGRVGTIKKLLEKDIADDQFPQSNQYVWAKKYLDKDTLIELDTNCEIFCTFSPEAGKEYLPKGGNDYFLYYQFMKEWFSKNFLVENQRIFNRITNTWPCHIHFNGDSKWLIDNDIINMVYSRFLPSENIEFLFEQD